jgi:thiosulfate/3-mercaptopyruvate sulfurtransferase
LKACVEGHRTVTADAYPDDVLVSPEWVRDRLDRFESPDTEYRLLEVDLNTDFYDHGHVPGALAVDWTADLQADDRRDLVGPTAFADLLGECGVTEDTTLVVYGDNANWFATHCYWLCTYYGHADVRVVDGGREYWLEADYPTTTAVPRVPTVEYTLSGQDESVRAYRDDVLDALDDDTVFVDVRMPAEFSGEVTAPPGYNEAALRGGHLPGAVNVLWADNMRPDRRFKSPSALRDLYAAHGIGPETDVVTYCRIGERSSVTWFVLTELLGYESVRNYDGSWAEWGNMVGVPIERGT